MKKFTTYAEILEDKLNPLKTQPDNRYNEILQKFGIDAITSLTSPSNNGKFKLIQSKLAEMKRILNKESSPANQVVWTDFIEKFITKIKAKPIITSVSLEGPDKEKNAYVEFVEKLRLIEMETDTASKRTLYIEAVNRLVQECFNQKVEIITEIEPLKELPESFLNYFVEEYMNNLTNLDVSKSYELKDSDTINLLLSFVAFKINENQIQSVEEENQGLVSEMVLEAVQNKINEYLDLFSEELRDLRGPFENYVAESHSLIKRQKELQEVIRDQVLNLVLKGVVEQLEIQINEKMRNLSFNLDPLIHEKINEIIDKLAYLENDRTEMFAEIEDELIYSYDIFVDSSSLVSDYVLSFESLDEKFESIFDKNNNYYSFDKFLKQRTKYKKQLIEQVSNYSEIKEEIESLKNNPLFAKTKKTQKASLELNFLLAIEVFEREVRESFLLDIEFLSLDENGQKSSELLKEEKRIKAEFRKAVVDLFNQKIDLYEIERIDHNANKAIDFGIKNQANMNKNERINRSELSQLNQKMDTIRDILNSLSNQAKIELPNDELLKQALFEVYKNVKSLDLNFFEQISTDDLNKFDQSIDEVLNNYFNQHPLFMFDSKSHNYSSLEVIEKINNSLNIYQQSSQKISQQMIFDTFKSFISPLMDSPSLTSGLEMFYGPLMAGLVSNRELKKVEIEAIERNNSIISQYVFEKFSKIYRSKIQSIISNLK